MWLDDTPITGSNLCIDPKISNEDDCVDSGSTWEDYNLNSCDTPVMGFPGGDI